MGGQAQISPVSSVDRNDTATRENADEEGYMYDIFVSYDRAQSEWALEFLEALRAELQGLRVADARIFFDLKEIRAGQVWEEDIQNALLRSRTMS